ncbi:uncharacterized protein LOC129615637 [Condylostylus longicornis]|uniref:uncharacterized protein LOC129615637 n=1 Tax=Condylostylus longicornis TaxID=2530218 RepID=UPI00244DB45D|nr:uncharacterized protein LOC129615637 [Condylostylus longicornis]
MREINNGTLKGLLKKTNRPPQTRKNRVVFDETRNEFFEADYIILIREECTYSEDDEEPCSCAEQDFVKKCYDESCQCNYEVENKSHIAQQSKAKNTQNPKNLAEVTEETLSPPDGYKDNRPVNPISEALSGHIFGTHHIQQLQVIQKLQQQRAAILAARINIQNKINEQHENNICNECVECVECSQNSIESLGVVAPVSLIPFEDTTSKEKITQKEIIAGEEHPKYKVENDSKVDTFQENHDARTQTKTTTDDSAKSELVSDNSTINGILKGGKLKQGVYEQKLEVDKQINEKADENYKRSVRFSTQNKVAVVTETKNSCAREENDLINELIPIRKHSRLFNNVNKPNSAVRQLFPEKSKQDRSNQSYEKNDLQMGKRNQDLIRMNIERGTLRRSLLRKKNGKSETSLEEQLKLLTCDIEDSNEEIQQIKNSYGCEFVELENTCDENICGASFSAVYNKAYISDTYIPCSSADKSNCERNHEDIILEQPVLMNADETLLSAAPDIALEMHIPINEVQYQQATYRNNEHKRFLSTFVPLTSCMAGQKDDLPYCTIEEYKENKPDDQTNKQNFNKTSNFNNDGNSKVAPDVIVGTPGLEQQLLSQIAKYEVTQKKKTQNKNQKLSSSNNSDDDEQSDYGFNKRPSVKGIKTKYKTDTTKNNKDSEKEKSGTKMDADMIDKTNTQHSNSLIAQQRSANLWNYADLDKVSVDNFPASPYPVESIQIVSGQRPNTNHSCNITNITKKSSKFQKTPTSKRPESPPPYKNYYQTMVLIPCNTGSYTTQYITNGEHHHIHSKNILEYQKVTQQTIRVPISYSFPSMKMHLARDRDDLNMCYGFSNPKGNVNIAQVIQIPNVDEKALAEGAAAISFSECKQIISTAKLSSFGPSDNTEHLHQDSDITFYANNVEKL